MKRVALFLMVSVLLCGGVYAQEEEGSAVDGLKNVVTSAWNIIPSTVEIANGFLHWTFDKVHDGIHSLAEWLKIENLP